MKIKKTSLLFLFFYFFNTQAHSANIIWYVCAALSKPAKKLASMYNKKNGIKVNLIIGGTGELVSKILISEKGDLFTPPCNYYRNLLKKKKIIIYSESLLKQTPVFALSKSGEKKITNFLDLTKKGVEIALGNSKTMALGKIFLKIKSDMPCITFKIEQNKKIDALNILQIVNYLKMNIIDAGILFDSLARTNHFKYVNIPHSDKYIFIGSINILKFTSSFNKSEKFIDFIKKNKNIFEIYHYKPLPSNYSRKNNNEHS